jgi:2'-5' RNA ligase
MSRMLRSSQAIADMETNGSVALEELEHFRNIRWLRNHWSRPIRPRSYYWYLTFENCPQFQSLVRACQRAISFPYYDLLPLRELHLTLERIGPDRDITQQRLGAIEAAAIRACGGMPSFNVTIGYLGGTRGAIGLAVHPAQPVRELRDTLRAVTLSTYPKAHVRGSEFHPHVAIAYANSDDVPTTEAIAAVEKLNPKAQVGVTITHATLVLLERRPRSYEWQVVSRIPLAG